MHATSAASLHATPRMRRRRSAVALQPCTLPQPAIYTGLASTGHDHLALHVTSTGRFPNIALLKPRRGHQPKLLRLRRLPPPRAAHWPCSQLLAFLSGGLQPAV